MGRTEVVDRGEAYGERYDTAAAYEAALAARALVPQGFRFAATAAHFTPAELGAAGEPLPVNLACILAPAATRAWSALLTSNRVTGAPVEIVRGHRDHALPVRGIVVNNRVANVCAPGGEAAARALLAAVGESCALPAAQLLPASTGVIGWRLPVAALSAAAPALAAGLARGTPLDVARAMMTTDAYPKLRSARTAAGHRVLGIAKGAGMIEPNLATMLVFLITDAPATAAELHRDLQRAVERSFNRITIDGDQSTSDLVLLLSSHERGTADQAPDHGLAGALEEVCAALAGDLVRNGEGTRHVIEISVQSHLAEAEAAALGKAVGNAPLVKTAVYGNDPNIGRIAGAVGDFLGSRRHLHQLGARHLAITIGDHQVFADGTFTIGPATERELSNYLRSCQCDSSGGFPPHDRLVRIGIRLDPARGGPRPGDPNGDPNGAGTGGTTAGDPPTVRVLASDLGYEYVRENADYRT